MISKHDKYLKLLNLVNPTFADYTVFFFSEAIENQPGLSHIKVHIIAILIYQCMLSIAIARTLDLEMKVILKWTSVTEHCFKAL